MVKGGWPCRRLKYIDYTTGSARLFSRNPAENAFGGVQRKRCPFDSVSIKAGACLFPHFLLCPGIAFHHHYRQRPAIWEICRPLSPSITLWPLVVHSITRKTNTHAHTHTQTNRANCKRQGRLNQGRNIWQTQTTFYNLLKAVYPWLSGILWQTGSSLRLRPYWAVVAAAEIRSTAFSQVSCRKRITVHQDAWKIRKYL